MEKMTTQEVWRLYWQAIDGSRTFLSSRVFNTGNGGAKAFLERCETLLGWGFVLKLGPQIASFCKEQRQKAMIGKCEERFLSEMPDQSGQRIVPGFDMRKAEDLLRTDLALFVQVTQI